MKKILFVEIPVSICVSYTLITLIHATMMHMKGYNELPVLTGYMTIICCFIAVVTLYGQKLLPNWPPIIVMILQYIFGVAMIVLFVFITGLFEPLHPDGYKDAINSFTPFFIIGAIVYYVAHFIEVKRQNKLLQSIKSNR